jgi:hypothetical protein
MFSPKQTRFEAPRTLSLLSASKEDIFDYLNKIEAVAVLMPHIDLDATLHGSYIAGTDYRR